MTSAWNWHQNSPPKNRARIRAQASSTCKKAVIRRLNGRRFSRKDARNRKRHLHERHRTGHIHSFTRPESGCVKVPSVFNGRMAKVCVRNGSLLPRMSDRASLAGCYAWRYMSLPSGFTPSTTIPQPGPVRQCHARDTLIVVIYDYLENRTGQQIM